MKRLLLFPLLAAGALTEDDKLMDADLGKLRDPARREAEVARLADCDGKKTILKSYRFLRCPQKPGLGDLFAVAADYDFHFEADDPPWRAYRIEKPEELFQGKTLAEVSLEPSLLRIQDHALLVFGPDGKELRPFGGSNWISSGYLFDLNGDGILERADHENYAVDGAEDQDIQVFELETLERKSKSLLRVIYNWHPDDADEVNEWGFWCFDEEGDGLVEIGFGPKAATSDAEQRRFVFRWDAVAKRYSEGEIPARSHIRVMAEGETLEEIAKAGGPDYPVEGTAKGDDAVAVAPKPPGKPYVFQSLKGAADAEVLGFFRGKQRRDSFDGPEDAVDTGLPAGFWELAPKQAALAFAEANRTPTHRQRWKLAVDDRGGIAPPESGWVLHDWNSSGCYSFSKHVFALRFGVAEPVLVATDYNSHGVVGRNPLADQPGSTARLISLSEKEARFLADTVFWLDRIRAHTEGGRDDRVGGMSSSADGFGTLHLLADGSAPRKMASDTVWATRSISAQWVEEYSPEVCLNLTEHLLADALPAFLGKRWEIAPEIDRRSLMTPLEKRLEPRHDLSARDLLTETIGRILERHRTDPVPAPAVEELVDCAGQEALLELRPALDRLLASLPERGGEDEEFEALRKRFTRDHFGNATRDDPSDHPKDYARYEALQEKRELQPGPVLREPLTAALEKLRIAGSSELLLKEVRGNGDHARWALDRLRRSFPAIWSDHLIGGFRDGNLEERRNLFQTLAAANPRAAKDLIALMSPREIGDLLIEVASFQNEQDPAAAADRVPALLETVRQRKENYIRRGQAMHLLGRMKLDGGTATELTRLLLVELKDPQKGEYPGAHTFSEAIDALSRLPGATAHLDEITAAVEGGYHGFSTGIEALLRLTEGRPDRRARLETFVRPRLKEHTGMMNDVFLTALALDLRGLAPEIAAMASEGPGVADGDAANYSGGNFKGPAGERYHAAREVTALWSEPDAATRSRMWIALVTGHAYEFDPESRDSACSTALHDRAAAAIRELPVEARREAIGAMMAATPGLGGASGASAWLRGLAPAAE